MTAASDESAVIDTDSAVSPRARWVMRFAVVPPGEAPSRTSPTASTGSRLNTSATPNASSGLSTSRFARPMRTPRGCVKIRRKSSMVSDNPRLIMISARAMGRAISASTGRARYPRRRATCASWSGVRRQVNTLDGCPMVMAGHGDKTR
jgi:hypothetical protein